MQHREIEAEGFIERYLLDQLPAEDAERFEDHYLSCEACLDQLELARALRDGLRTAAAEDAARIQAAGGLGLLAWLARRRRGMQVAVLTAAAAGLAVLFWNGALLWQGSSGERPAAASPAANTPVFFLGPQRGAAAEPTAIRPGAGDSAFVLGLEVEAAPEDGPFAVELASVAGEGPVLWRGEGLRLDHNRVLTVSVPAGFLAAGDYRLQVTAAGGETRFVFGFRVLPAAS